MTVDIQSPPEDGAEALVAAGRADIGVSFQDFLAPAFAMENPLPLTVIATLINHNTSGIVSLKDKAITSPAKLEGHTYATWNLPIEQAILKQVMTDDQGDWSRVELFPSTVTDIQASLQTQVDAVWIYYGWDGVALEQTDLETNYWYFTDINSVFDYYGPLLFANNNFLEKKIQIRLKRSYVRLIKVINMRLIIRKRLQIFCSKKHPVLIERSLQQVRSG